MEQVHKYAVNPAVQRLAGSTQLHTLCGAGKRCGTVASRGSVNNGLLI
jgi:hypothetical protein